MSTFEGTAKHAKVANKVDAFPPRLGYFVALLCDALTSPRSTYCPLIKFFGEGYGEPLFSKKGFPVNIFFYPHTPVLPKPPAPRTVSESSDTSSKLAAMYGVTTSCAMRSPGWIACGSVP